jgi:hypothetical protein
MPHAYLARPIELRRRPIAVLTPRGTVRTRKEPGRLIGNMPISSPAELLAEGHVRCSIGCLNGDCQLRVFDADHSTFLSTARRNRKPQPGLFLSGHSPPSPWPGAALSYVSPQPRRRGRAHTLRFGPAPVPSEPDRPCVRPSIRPNSFRELTGVRNRQEKSDHLHRTLSTD